MVKYIKRQLKSGAILGSCQPQSADERLWEFENRPMDAEKTIYLSGPQASLLLSNLSHYLRTVLIAEFGAGNMILSNILS